MEFTIVEQKENEQVSINEVDIPIDYAAEMIQAKKSLDGDELPDEETIIQGEDAEANINGRKITNPSKYWPSGSIGLIRSNKQGGIEYGTGGVLFRRMIITAGHVALDFGNGKSVKRYPLLEFHPGWPDGYMYNDNPKRKPLRSWSIVYPTAFGKDKKAYAHLDCAIVVPHEETSHLSTLGLYSGYFSNHDKPTFGYGYPMKNQYLFNKDRPEQYMVSGNAKRDGKGVFFPNNDFSEGASGGPWMSKHPDNRYYCTGVNAQEVIGNASGVYSSMFSKWIWDMVHIAKQKRDEY